jgi:hypothetical protein
MFVSAPSILSSARISVVGMRRTRVFLPPGPFISARIVFAIMHAHICESLELSPVDLEEHSIAVLRCTAVERA